MPRPQSGTDVHVYNALDKITSYFCKYNIHPNVITLVSLLSNKILFERLKKPNKNLNTIFLIMISHAILDCLDGEVARKCNKYSKLGSRLDYINDHIFISILILYFINKFHKINYNYKNIVLLVLLISVFNISILDFNIDNHEMESEFAKKIHDNSVLVVVLVFLCITYF